MLCALSRRALLSSMAILAPQMRPPAAAAAGQGLQYFATRSGLTYFDTKITRDNGFDFDYPCTVSNFLPCRQAISNVDPAAVLPAPAADGLPDGAEIVLEYRIRRGSFTGDIVALSDGPGNGGSLIFRAGDRSVNAAVDELARSLPCGTVRRAIVPAAFDLDRGTRATYPEEEPAGTTYLEMSLRKLTASNSVGSCPGGDERYTRLASSICGAGPVKAELLDGYRGGGFAG